MIKHLINEFAREELPYKMGGISVSAAKKISGFQKIDKLSANENPFGVSEMAMAAVKEAAGQGNYYPDPASTDLVENLCGGLGIGENQILLTHGATAALSMAGEVLLRPGDEMIIPELTYPAYYNIVYKSRARLMEIPMGEGLKIDLDGILEQITERTKLIILCNPNNPTGIYMSTWEILDFLDRIPPHVFVMVDEAYVHFAEEDIPSMVPYITEKRNLIVVQTFSKIYGMAGYRMGYVISNPEIISYLSRDLEPYAPGSLAIAAAAAAIKDEEFKALTLKLTGEGKSYLTGELRALGCKVYPSATNFIYFDCGIDPRLLTEQTVKKCGVLIRGNFPCARITIGKKEQNETFIKAMKEILHS